MDIIFVTFLPVSKIDSKTLEDLKSKKKRDDKVGEEREKKS